MTKPFKGRPSWVMQFLTSSEGRVNCIWFRTAGVLLPIISHLHPINSKSKTMKALSLRSPPFDVLPTLAQKKGAIR
jgi:hypothetical protein